ncbi:22052_t:CDS:2, partial [Racocetra persica]
NNNEESKQRKVDGQDYKPYFYVKTPLSRVVTPPYPPRTPEHQTFSLSSFASPTISENEETDSDDDTDKRNPNNYTFDEYVDVLTRIIMTMIRGELQADNFSDLQIEQFSKGTLVDFHKHIRNTCIVKTKVSQDVKTTFRECIEYQTALDEDLGLKEAERIVEQSFTKTFNDPIDQKKTKNIPVKPLKDLLSEGTLTVNIISPILRSFFHDSSKHLTKWPNTASMSSKVRKLANSDPSRAKQLDMICNVVNNNKSKYEVMF